MAGAGLGVGGAASPPLGWSGACRSMCGPTTRARGVRSAWPGSRSPWRDFDHGDEVTVVHRAFELDRHAPARVEGTHGGASAPQVRHAPRTGPGRPRAADRARGGGGLHLRLRPGAVGQHVRCPPAHAGGARDRARGRAGAGPVRRPLQRGAAALGSRCPARRRPRSRACPTDVTEKVLGGTAGVGGGACRRGGRRRSAT